MNDIIELEKMLQTYDIPLPYYHCHSVQHQDQHYQECIIEIPELFIEVSSMAESLFLAKNYAANLALSKILELKLLPLHEVA